MNAFDIFLNSIGGVTIENLDNLWDVQLKKCIKILKHEAPHIKLPEIHIIKSNDQSCKYIKIGEQPVILLDVNSEYYLRMFNEYTNYDTKSSMFQFAGNLISPVLDNYKEKEKFSNVIILYLFQFYLYNKAKKEFMENDYKEILNSFVDSYSNLNLNEQSQNEAYYNLNFENYIHEYLQSDRCIFLAGSLYDFQILIIIMHELCHYIFEHRQDIGEIKFHEKEMNTLLFYLQNNIDLLDESEFERSKVNDKHKVSIEGSSIAIIESLFFKHLINSTGVNPDIVVNKLIFTDYKKMEEVYVDGIALEIIFKHVEMLFSEDLDHKLIAKMTEEDKSISIEDDFYFYRNGIYQSIIYSAYLQNLHSTKSFELLKCITNNGNGAEIYNTTAFEDSIASVIGNFAYRYYYVGVDYLNKFKANGIYDRCQVFNFYESFILNNDASQNNIINFLSEIYASIIDTTILQLRSIMYNAEQLAEAYLGDYESSYLSDLLSRLISTEVENNITESELELLNNFMNLIDDAFPS